MYFGWKLLTRVTALSVVETSYHFQFCMTLVVVLAAALK